MRLLLVLPVLAVLVACNDHAPPVAPDGSVDASIDAGAPGPVDGAWALDWTCIERCAGTVPAPVVSHSDRLTIDGAVLRWHSTTCIECAREHVGVVRANCVDVPAGRDGLDIRAAFSVCTDAPDRLTATVEVERDGGAGEVTAWRVTGARL